MRRLVLVFLFACSAFADPADDFLRAEIQKRQIPGLSVAVIKNGKLEKLAAYGLANIEHNVSASPKTVFQIQSITKTFTAAAALMLVDEGKLALSDPVGKHLAGAPELWKDITVRHLLNHTSGIKDFINQPTASLRLDVSEQEVFESLITRQLNFKPGEKYAYSNSGYHLLAMIVRKHTGKSYGDFLAERIFKPLEMNETRLYTAREIIPNRAAGYVLENNKLRNGQFIAESVLAYGGGGIISTAADMAKWAQALDNESILKKSRWAEAWIPAKLNSGATSNYGLGFATGSVNEHRFVAHGGAHSTGFTSHLQHFPDDRLTIVILTNARHGTPGQLTGQVAGLYNSGLKPPAPKEQKADVSFKHDIAPILSAKCLSCHGAGKAKGGYRLDNFAAMIVAGESKAAPVTAGKPKDSRLLHLLTAKDDADRMPQKDEPLPAAQIELIEQWIAAGAMYDGDDPRTPIALLAPPPYKVAPLVYPQPIPITALAFTSDGRQLAASGYHEVTIWNVDDGKLAQRIGPLARQINALDYAADGSLAVAAGTPGGIGELSHLMSGSIKPLARSLDVMLATRFSPTSNRLLSTGADNIIRLFDAASGKPLLKLEPHADWITAAVFSRDSNLMLTASRDRTARVIDAAKGEIIATYTGHTEPVLAADFSADGKLAYTAGRDRKIHIWQTGGEAKKTGEITGFDGDILRIVVSGDYLFTACTDRKVRQHSTTSRELIREFEPHKDWVTAIAVHEKSQRLASASHDGEIRIWDLTGGKLSKSFIAAPGHLKKQ